MRRVLLVVVTVVCAAGLAQLRTFPPMATVMSASMEPGISVGDVVLFKATGGRLPSIGDVVEVPVPAEYQAKHGYPSVVIHRVVGVDVRGEITTQGDNLGSPDPFTVPASSVSREVVAVVPLAGRLLGFVTSPLGLLWLAVGAALLVVRPLLESLRPVPVAAPVDGRVEELVAAVSDYGEHLRSHTAIVQSMSRASQDLADVVARMQRDVVDDGAVELDATALHHLTASGAVHVEAVAPGRYRVRPLT